MLPHYDVYITDWIDARTVPALEGSFDLDDYVDYVTEFLRHLDRTPASWRCASPRFPSWPRFALMNAARILQRPRP